MKSISIQAISPSTGPDVMLEVGTRVRKARQDIHVSRKVLSQQSGVSQRYLAELEAGRGNISITLLHRIATALGQPMERFVSENPNVKGDLAQLLEGFQLADAATREAVLDMLPSVAHKCNRANRICLIGLRGAGKSTLGKSVAEQIGLRFLELNDQIETDAGMAVPEIMALYGQEGYRRLEGEAIRKIVQDHEKVLLAVAGGIVEEEETFAWLLDHFHTVWIKAAPEEHMERVRAQGDTRPMAGNPKAMEELRSILTDRESIYSRAHICLDTSGKAVETSKRDLLTLIDKKEFAGGRSRRASG